MKGVHVLPVYGGQGYGVQLSALRRGVHVIVGTPGRIMDHLAKGTLDEPTKVVSSAATASAFQKAMTQVMKTYRVMPSTVPMDELLPKFG